MNLIYPGSFDPITYGHIDIIERSAKMCTKFYVAVLINSSKNAMFEIDERIELIKHCIQGMDNVEVITFNGLLVELFQELEIHAIVKGLRAVSDFEYEFQMAQINRTLCPQAETLFMRTNPKYSYLSSSVVKEIFHFNGNIDKFVPDYVRDAMIKKRSGK